MKGKKRKGTFDYQMLGRLQSDCDYFIGNGRGSVRGLWASSVDAQIKEMKRIWEKLPKKPEWLSMTDIEDYAKKMHATSVDEGRTVAISPPPGKGRVERHSQGCATGR